MSTESPVTAAVGLWERAKSVFLSVLPTVEERSQAERYFGMITHVECVENTYTIYVMTSFAATTLETDYAAKLKSAFSLLGKTVELAFKVDERPVSEEKPIPLVRPPVRATSVPRETHFVSTMPLNPEYTFAQFVTGPSNSFAYAAAQGTVIHPGKIGYNPLFIHGDTGLGKTHLMQAIGNELKRQNPQLAICYLTAETFLNEFVNSMTNDSQAAFRQKYRNIDVLLLDDVQFLQRGKAVQEEFFNTFYALQQANKQIVMTSDVAPKNLPLLEKRLISRFEGGIVQEIDTPSYETRLAILKKKSENCDIKIADYILDYIADNIKSHVRAMEGALGKVCVYISASKNPTPSKETLGEILNDVIQKEQTLRTLSIKEIQDCVAAKYAITIKDIQSTDRSASLVTPRQLAMYISRKLTTKSLKEIAAAFEKSHATVNHGVKTIEQRLDTEADLKSTLEEIVNSLGYRLSDAID